MLLRLAFRGLRDRPWRSAFLLAGFALGVGVMITLLAIGEAMVVQSKDEKLVGGGDVTVLPEGIDLEVMKTGGVGGMFASIANARFVYRQVLASPRFADRIATVAPQTDGVLLYLRTADGTEYPVRALGEIPSASRAVGAAPTLIAGAWEDDDGDRRWQRPTVAELRHEIDRFHHTPAAIIAEERPTWGEWHYFNVLSDDAKRWAFLTLAVGGDIPDGRWGGQVLLTLHAQGRAPRRFTQVVPSQQITLDTTRADLAVGTNTVTVLPDGRYEVRARAREDGTGAEATVALILTPAPGAYFPGTSIGDATLVSGYAVPALRGTIDGTICVERRCERYSGAPGYHDHNWGVWRDVEWEWGAARLGEFSVLYGRVRRSGADDVREPLFVYLVDSLGFRSLFRPKAIRYEDGRTVMAEGRRLQVPSRALLEDIRGGDTLRIALEIEDAMASDVRLDRMRQHGTLVPRRPDAARTFLVQMKGTATLTGRIGGQPVSGRGTGFFETYR